MSEIKQIDIEIEQKVNKQPYFVITKNKKCFKCNYGNCKKAFKEKGNLRTHMRIHVNLIFKIKTGERPFICDFQGCGKKFITLGNLKSHAFNHTGQRFYKCPFYGCKMEYSRICRLKIHERTHTGDKPYCCPYPNCGKTFNEKGNLKTHFRIHTGEKPFKCSFEGCLQAFKAHGHLKDHIKRHSRGNFNENHLEFNQNLEEKISSVPLENVCENKKENFETPQKKFKSNRCRISKSKKVMQGLFNNKNEKCDTLIYEAPRNENVVVEKENEITVNQSQKENHQIISENEINANRAFSEKNKDNISNLSMANQSKDKILKNDENEISTMFFDKSRSMNSSIDKEFSSINNFPNMLNLLPMNSLLSYINFISCQASDNYKIFLLTNLSATFNIPIEALIGLMQQINYSKIYSDMMNVNFLNNMIDYNKLNSSNIFLQNQNIN